MTDEAVTIRQAEPWDHEGIADVVAAAWPDDLELVDLARLELSDSIAPRPWFDARGRWVVASSGGRIVGIACWSPSGLAHDMVDFSWAAVRPDFRRRGVSTALLDERLAAVRRWLGNRCGYVQVRTWPVAIYQIMYLLRHGPRYFTGRRT